MANLHYHLLEIKLRCFYLILSWICTFVISYNCQIEIIYLIGKPFIELQQTFIFLDLTEAFYTLLRISTILTCGVILPFFVYEIWSFFVPSLYEIERKKMNSFFLLFVSLLVCEILFAYFFLLPKICHFLLSFEMTSGIDNSDLHRFAPLISVEFTARIESYVKLIVKLMGLILLLFQIPLGVLVLYSNKILHVSSFYFNRKLLSFLSLLFSALLVPPDVVSQVIVAIFFYLVFEFLIWIGLFFE